MDPSSSRLPPPHHAPAVNTQPKVTRLSLQGFLELPRRLCTPPKAVGKVRSFGLTPIFDVTLDDVLDRKHLPPLSLKDFEEWLLFVEQCPENLYFILWLREYVVRYDAWVNKVRVRESRIRAREHKRGNTSYRVPRTVPASPALALFFSRARETFFAPGSPYELILPPHLLAPFFRNNSTGAPAASPHPDPTMFDPLRTHIENCLRTSLHNFVRASYTNVGSYRALCGICAGIFFSLLGSVPPIVVNFVRHDSRWERFVALPGLWFGLTIFIASLRGVCMMIYVFGDFRQLRRFELDRPAVPSSPTETVISEKSFLEQNYTHTLPALPLSVAVPARPVRALTAPPKISIFIPSRPSDMSTPALSLGTTTSATGLTTEVSVFTDSRFSDANDATLHTISISSVKSDSRGANTSFAQWPHGHRSSDDARSIALSVSTTEEMHNNNIEVEADDVSGDEDESSDEENGIYVSPVMPAPEDTAEEDPAVLNAALAMIAADSNSYTSPARSGSVPTVQASPVGIVSPTSTIPSVTQTAGFIPAFQYTAIADEKKEKRVSNSSERDLERGMSSPETQPTVLPLGAFDFDALPPPPPSRLRDYTASQLQSPAEETLAEGNSPIDEKARLTCTLDTPSTAVFTGMPFHEPLSARIGIDGRKNNNGTASGRSVVSDSLRTRLASRMAFLLRPLNGGRTSCPSATASTRIWTESKNDIEKDAESPRSLFTWVAPPAAGGVKRNWRRRIRTEQRTPAFGPVTRVLNPVVARAQWEIVVRAACLAAILSSAIVGALVAVPVPAMGQ